MVLKYIYIICLLFISTVGLSSDDICDKWFEKLKIHGKPDCYVKCLSAHVEKMKTDHCIIGCERRCAQKIKKKSYKLVDKIVYYPGLNKFEQALIKKYPKEAIIVFLQKEIAEYYSEQLFGRGEDMDESDAVRHFLWAGLLYKELGPDIAKEFLDAHEASEDNNSASKAMDLANNRAGLLAADKLKRENKLDVDNLKIEAVSALKNNSLIVLKPQGGLP